ncbi:hypothetical protein [Mesorhizobium sp. Pch-S]|uniref:hypothetical protein n=1 Tax=Mesorhizobium sp. Pch-S TaxID=2082387 RepID=UPI00101390AD|nr:hypothetical protein [Mesorhizobium sp. Pch-S]
MTSYIPEHYYGLVPGSYREPGGERYGLIPWPAHMRPQQQPSYAPLPDIDLRQLFGETEGIELTKKGEAYAEAAKTDVFFLRITPKDRTSIAYTIESLINLLDAMEPDPDLEPDLGSGDDREGNGGAEGGDEDREPSLGWSADGQVGQNPAWCNCWGELEHDDADDEFTLGWEKGSMPYDQTYLNMFGTDEAEDVSEDEGATTGDDEYSLGTTEEIDQERRQDVAEGYFIPDGEPYLGWAESFGRGVVGEQDCLDDREHEDEREQDQAEMGIADQDALQDPGIWPSHLPTFPGCKGAVDFQGDGVREANAMLKKARAQQARPSASPNIINLRNFAPTDDDILSLDMLAHYRAAHGQRPC